MSRKKPITTRYSKTKDKKPSLKPSLKTWVCPHKCKLTAIPCPHLEKLIQPVEGSEPRFESVNKYIGNNVEKNYYESGAGYIIPPGIKNRSYEYKFRSKLEKAGLEPVGVDVLVLRFVYNMNIMEIAEELGMFSRSTVIRLLDSNLEILKKKKGWNK